jgi:uncharacterized repeat protein (TIGR01451 family)
MISASGRRRQASPHGENLFSLGATTMLRMVPGLSSSAENTVGRLTGVWRLAVIALGTLILCSCQGPATPAHRVAAVQPEACPAMPPPCAGGPPAGPPGMEAGVPLPYVPVSDWQPPGIAGPWPAEEYVRDGGIAGPAVRVTTDHEVRGLKMDDTIAHFDTLDGRTLVQPSNEVYLYAPRFAAVRQVVDVQIEQQDKRAAGVAKPEAAAAPATREKLAVGCQRIRSVNEIGDHPAELLRSRQPYGVVSTVLGPVGFENSYKAYENAAVIRQGVFIESERALVAKGVAAAVRWTQTQSVQIILEQQTAAAAVRDEKLQTTYTVDLPDAHPRLRLIKVASTSMAQPGEEVAFTIRFDNVGNQQIRHVTILDSLDSRLEFVRGSAQCSVDARFSTQANEGESVVLRCELAAPLARDHGGVLRFLCRMR